jgi:hypothetical protein
MTRGNHRQFGMTLRKWRHLLSSAHPMNVLYGGFPRMEPAATVVHHCCFNSDMHLMTPAALNHKIRQRSKLLVKLNAKDGGAPEEKIVSKC